MSHVAVVATSRAREGLSEDLGAALQALVVPSRADEGSLTYEVHRSESDADVWMVYERWASQAAFEAHLATPHLGEFLARVPELVDGELDIATFSPVSVG